MENSFLKITLLNSINNILSLKYGSVNIEYQDENTRKEVAEIIRTVNLIAGDEVISEAPYFENIPTETGWEETEVPGKYRLIYGDRHNPVPVVTKDDLNVWNEIEVAAKDKELCRLQVNPALHKKVRRSCKDAGVVFKAFGDIITIDGREKAMSVYKRIHKAFSDGANSVSFDLNEISMPTVRTYASQFGSAVNQKVRCSVKDGMITVHFKEGLESEIKHIWDTYVATEGEDTVKAAFAVVAGENGVNFDPAAYISKSPIESIDMALEELVWSDRITPEVYNEIKRLLSSELAQEPRQLPSVTVTTGNSENNAIKPAAIGDGDDSDPAWEEVDGMKQIIIPGLNMESFTNETQRVFEARLEDQIKSDAPKLPEDGDF